MKINDLRRQNFLGEKDYLANLDWFDDGIKRARNILQTEELIPSARNSFLWRIYPKDLVDWYRPHASVVPDERPPRTPAGRPCPKEGWWFTPAATDSRRFFKQDEAMPEVKIRLWLNVLAVG
ncbi:hypothetical protein [Ralstonia flaminis]|jgi:hypothetical protein|uniref:Uncharacterized protein n=1 Tax=Ralstonia flaminis TaxID=3058597 RepID=A0ABM9KCC1_9RALS|nr:hypothetical protein [Ralstonia sp. LMG 18101]CAJ0820871.1 hypothetical protein LMG18101_04433 [Ralstonia sp. LMG 18101]